MRDKFEIIFDNLMLVYLKWYSCEIILIWLVEDWKYGRDVGEIVVILLIDMSKVFDFVYLILYKVKLKVYGFCESVLNLMKFFFDGRKNRLWVGMVISSWKEIRRGFFIRVYVMEYLLELFVLYLVW